MKNFFYFTYIATIFLFILIINLFLKINSDINHIIGINIIIFITLIISFFCQICIYRIFKKANLSSTKEFKKNIKITIANSFFKSSIISIICALLIYVFLKNVLNLLTLKQGLINYTIYASKIWFVSSPFIGLELTVFKYFSEIKFYKTPIKILILKLLSFFIISFLCSFQYKQNCFLYAKPICDILFLPYYTKICFDLTLK